MDDVRSTTGPRPAPPMPAVHADDLADGLEERLAREDLAAAQATVRGEEWARARAWKLHVRAKQLGHGTWAAALLARAQVAQAHEAEARAAVRTAVEQLGRLQAQRKVRAPARGKAAAFERDLVRVVEKFAEVEEAAKGVKKAVAVKDKLSMSLPTYRSYVAEARRRGLL